MYWFGVYVRFLGIIKDDGFIIWLNMELFWV